MKSAKYAIALILFFLFYTCSDPCKELTGKIRKTLMSENNVTKEEWAEICDFINEYQPDMAKCKPQLFDNNGLIVDSLCNFILQIAKDRKGNNKLPEIENFKPEEIEVKPKIKVFLENSGSMHGYVKGNTKFEAAIGELLVKVVHIYDKENIHLHYINREIIPINVEVERFIDELEPNKISKGDISSSNLNKIFKVILTDTANGIANDEIGILISDCIYSITGVKGTDTESLLSHERNLTMNAFFERFKMMKPLKLELATIVLKLNSNFEGYYFIENNSRKKSREYIKEQRPYYIWIIGRNDLIDKFYKQIPLNDLDGYDNIYILAKSNPESCPCTSILPVTNKVGSFRKDRENNNALIEIEPSNRPSNRGTFQFSIALSLNHEKLRVNCDYFKNMPNYTVLSKDSFQLSVTNEIHLDANERPECSPLTHVFTLTTNDLKTREQVVTIQLNKKIPKWVDDSHTLDDTDIMKTLDRTFGFSYLIEGVTEAYRTEYPDNTYYFQIPISLKR